MGGSVALRLKLVMSLSCKDGDSVIARAFAFRHCEGFSPWQSIGYSDRSPRRYAPRDDVLCSVIARRAMPDVAIYFTAVDSHGRYRSLGMTYPICHT